MKMIMCKNCGTRFKADKYNEYHQKYCGSILCRKASKKESDRKYRALKKNCDKFKEKEKARVKRWRIKNPDYSKKSRKKLHQEAALREVVHSELNNEIGALREVVIYYTTILKGDMSLRYDALRDDIADIEKRLYSLGSELSKDSDLTNFNIEPKEKTNAQEINSS